MTISMFINVSYRSCMASMRIIKRVGLLLLVFLTLIAVWSEFKYVSNSDIFPWKMKNSFPTRVMFTNTPAKDVKGNYYSSVFTSTVSRGTDTKPPLEESYAMGVCDGNSKLVGALKIDVNISLSNISRDGSEDMLPGGAWKPRGCVARHRVAIVIPYRDRSHHLQVILHYLLPVLKRQELDFRIFVVEQFGNKTFNKGRVMNAAYKEASKMADFQCFVFHDVDLLPEDDRNLYSCPKLPRHMSPAVDKFEYRIPYKKLVGGVFSIRTSHFQQVNGYSNLYWGWGGEDDDMSKRLDAMGLDITRSPSTIGRYKMMRHVHRENGPIKMTYDLLQTVGSRFRKDGLNSLEYKTMFINNTSFYTHIMVDVGDPPKSVPVMKLFM